MRKTVEKMLVMAGLMLSGSAFASYQLNCWDGSFAYNTVNVTETQEGYEISLTGSTLLQDSRNGLNWNPVTVHSFFSAGNCSFDATGSLNCYDRASDGISPGLVVEKIRPEPEESPYEFVQVQSLSFSAEDPVTLRVDGHVGDLSSNSPFTLGFTPWTCTHDGSVRTGGTQWGAARFKKQIREYLVP